MRFLPLLSLISPFVGPALASSFSSSRETVERLTADFVATFPSPLVAGGAELCGLPAPTSESAASSYPICDPSVILSRSDTLEVVASSLLDLSTVGLRICAPTDSVSPALVLIDRMRHLPLTVYDPRDDSPSADEMIRSAAELLAQGLHDSYGVGSCPPSCASACKDSNEFDNGLLIFVSVDDRVMYVSAGKGVKPLITEARVEEAIKAAKPFFKNRDVGEGLVEAIKVLKTFLEKGPPSTWEKTMTFLNTYWIGIWAVICFIGFVAWDNFSSQRRKDFEKVKRLLTTLEKEKAEALAGNFKCSSCPICLESFALVSDRPSETIGSDNQPVQLLRCGHVFDTTCFNEFTSSSANRAVCPICRERHGFATGEAVASDASVSHREIGRTTQPTYETQYASELDFRLSRLRSRYPRFISQRHITTFSDRSCVNFSNHPTFLAQRPRAAPSSSSNGSSGGRPSAGRKGGGFGGGRSGGGAGGRW